MIKFFRKIRLNLLSEGKTGKYFKYAIGEIVLVVIGILIALQINTLNQVKKDRAYEVKMLSEIEKGLRLDLSNLNEHYETYTTLKNTVDHFTNLTNDYVIFDESMQNDLWKLNSGRYL